MKTSIVILLFTLLFCTSCVKSIAGEEETIDDEFLHNRVLQCKMGIKMKLTLAIAITVNV